VRYYLVTYYTKDGRSIGRAFVRTKGFLNIARYEEENGVIVMSFQEIEEHEYLHAVVPAKVQDACIKLSREISEDIVEVDLIYYELMRIASLLKERGEKITKKKLKELYKESQGGVK